MYDKNNANDINRLKFENFIWVIFASICIINIFGDNNEINYLKTNNKSYDNKSNQIFITTFIGSPGL